MKAVFLNGSPRKNFNTAKLLESAMEGAIDSGIESIEFINLFDFEFTGCKSCFECKLKNSKTNGLCAIKDDLRPILEKTFDADIVVIGSPVYFSYPTGQFRNFLERFCFPIITYNTDEGGNLITVLHKKVKTALIFTMNCSEEVMKEIQYDVILGENVKTLQRIFGNCEVLYAYNTYQYTDYNLYECNIFNEEEKRKYHDEQFPIDLQKAYELGKKVSTWSLWEEFS